jgi:hypothetical protein
MTTFAPELIGGLWREREGGVLLLAVPGGGQVVAWGPVGGTLGVVHRYDAPVDCQKPAVLAEDLRRLAGELSVAAYGVDGVVQWRLLP